MNNSLSDTIELLDITIEDIKFRKWQGTNLEFECIDICTEEKVVMVLDS